MRTVRPFAVLPLLLAGLALLVPAPAFADDDEAWVMDILRKYSPDGFHVVDEYMKKDPLDSDFMMFFHGDTEEDRWHSINTIVHEQAHGYMAAFGGYDSTSFYVDRILSVRVKHTEVFRTNRIVTTVPEALRTFRFSYVDSDEETLGSQAEGAYGLLNEMAAYSVGSRAAYDLMAAYDAMGRTANWAGYLENVDVTLYGILEFRFFILRYLMFAKDREPKIYAGIVGNADFQKAFAAVDRKAAAFVEEYFKARQDVFARLRAQGYKVEEDAEGIGLMKDGEGEYFGTFMDVYEMLRVEMAKPAYAPFLSALYAGSAPAAYPEYARVAASYAGSTVVRVPAVPSAPAPSTPATSSASATTAAPASSPSAPAPTASGTRTGSSGSAAAGFSRSAGDGQGDGERGFIDMVGAEVTASGSDFVFRMELSSLPTSLAYGNPAVGADYVEYEWALDIDTEGNGSYELSLTLSYWKAEGAKPGKGHVLAFCTAGLWKVTPSSGELLDDEVGVEVDGNVIVFTVSGSSLLRDSRLGPRSSFCARTYLDYGNGTDTDTIVF